MRNIFDAKVTRWLFKKSIVVTNDAWMMEGRGGGGGGGGVKGEGAFNLLSVKFFHAPH